jgi:hypothetical protein
VADPTLAPLLNLQGDGEPSTDGAPGEQFNLHIVAAGAGVSSSLSASQVVQRVKPPPRVVLVSDSSSR